MSKVFNFNLLSQNRKYLMGIATILVMFCHSWSLYLENLIPNDCVKKIFIILRSNSTLGVEMFLILSAIGLYYSFKKDGKIKQFYKKRFLRIIPPILIVAILIYGIVEGNDIHVFLQRIFLVSLFTEGNLDLWFFSLLIILYLLFPILYKLREKFGNIPIIVLAILVIIINIIVMHNLPDFYNKCEIALTRIPIFLIGIVFADLSYNNKSKNFIIFWISLIMILFINVLYYYEIFNNCIWLTRYTNALLAIGYTIVFAYLLTKIKGLTFKNIISWVGSYSLEIYLLYEYLIKHCWTLFNYRDEYNITYYICVITLTIILQIALKNVTNEIQKIFTTTEKNN